MTPFAPIGEQARWRIVYDRLKSAAVGDVVTYDELGDALGLNPETDRHAIQMAVRRAAIEYQKVDKRALDAVPNKGYRVVEAKEHVVFAKRHQAKSARALAGGHSVVTHVDLSQVDEHTRRALENIAIALTVQMEFNRRMDVRQRRLEQAIAAQTSRAQRTEEELAALRADLEELKRRL